MSIKWPWETTHYLKVAKQNIEINELENQVEELKEDRKVLKEEVADLKFQKKIEDEDIKHMVKMEQERLVLDHEKLNLAKEAEYQDKLGAVKDDYRDKVEKNLETQLERMQGMYESILERLPNINVKMKGDLG